MRQGVSRPLVSPRTIPRYAIAQPRTQFTSVPFPEERDDPSLGLAFEIGRRGSRLQDSPCPSQELLRIAGGGRTPVLKRRHLKGPDSLEGSGHTILLRARRGGSAPPRPDNGTPEYGILRGACSQPLFGVLLKTQVASASCIANFAKPGSIRSCWNTANHACSESSSVVHTPG